MSVIKKELELYDLTSIREHFGTDIQFVLGYINNKSKRFKAFVTNRVQLICDNSNTAQWHHIDTTRNPTDDASRGLDMKNTKKVQRWYNGPDFMWQF